MRLFVYDLMTSDVKTRSVTFLTKESSAEQTSSLISKIWLFARSGRFQFSRTYIWKITFHTMRFEAIFVCRMRRIDLATMENREK
jgi:hypothetical protein